MKVKTAELIGPALDWAVASYADKHVSLGDIHWGNYQPSANWAQGGPIIEREGISVKENLPSMPDNRWNAFPSITAKGAGGKWGIGATPLIAAMRCYVASKLGGEVEVPEELLK